MNLLLAFAQTRAGEIPPTLGDLKRLQKLVLINNRLTGERVVAFFFAYKHACNVWRPVNI